MWMQDNIRKADFVVLVCTETYLRRVERREEPGRGRGVLWEATLIYNLLYPEDSAVQRFIPVVLANGQPSSIPLPLRGLTYYQVDMEEGYEDLYRHLTNQPRHEVPAVGKLRALPPKEPASFPASLTATPAPKRTTLNQRHREQLIKQVRLDWIDGVLDQSLYKVARIELGLSERPDFVEQPLHTVFRIPDQIPRALPANIPISQMFDEQAGAMLILGSPGTGKTTLLLELARDLLVRAEHDESYPIPVVLNLSSWAVRRQSLSNWIVTELNERSYVPKKVARLWLESEEILVLLDGLDEVATSHREVCVDAINTFRREHGLLPIAVASRVADYEALGTKLRLRSAVEVQPLTHRQIENYLQRVGGALEGLHVAVNDDPWLWQLIETPLMLSVAMLAYRDLPRASEPGASLEQHRRQLFAQFVEAMFHRKGINRWYSSDKIKRWLSSLARVLTRNNQTMFFLEDLDFEWLPTRPQQWLARMGLFVAIGLTCCLVSYLSIVLSYVVGSRLRFDLSPALRFGLIAGPIFALIIGGIIGLIFGPIGVVLKIKPVENVGLRWIRVRSQTGAAISEALTHGLITGLIVCLSGGLIFGLMIFWRSGWLSEDLVGVLNLGVVFGLIVGLMSALIRLFTWKGPAEMRLSVNEGTHRSIKIALMAWLVVGLIASVILWPICYGLFALGDVDIDPLGSAVGIGLNFGLIFGLFSGGLFAVKHLVLRLFLWKSGAAPLKYAAFLDQARELLFLRRVGAGYIFSHRLLRDYFLSLSDSEVRVGAHEV